VQDVLREDQIHHEFVWELQHGFENHLDQADLHVCAAN
jgi:hypothetical protein